VRSCGRSAGTDITFISTELRHILFSSWRRDNESSSRHPASLTLLSAAYLQPTPLFCRINSHLYVCSLLAIQFLLSCLYCSLCPLFPKAHQNKRNPFKKKNHPTSPWLMTFPVKSSPSRIFPLKVLLFTLREPKLCAKSLISNSRLE